MMTYEEILCELEELGLEVEVADELSESLCFKLSETEEFIFNVTSHRDDLRPHSDGLYFGIAYFDERERYYKPLYWPTYILNKADGPCNEHPIKMRMANFKGERIFFITLKKMLGHDTRADL